VAYLLFLVTYERNLNITQSVYRPLKLNIGFNLFVPRNSRLMKLVTPCFRCL